MITQLKFQQSVVFVDVPQIPFIDRVLDISVASQRLVPQCLLCRRPEIPWCSPWIVVDTPVGVQTIGPDGPDSSVWRCRRCSSCKVVDVLAVMQDVPEFPASPGGATASFHRQGVEAVRVRKSDAYASLLRFSHLSRGLRAGAHFLEPSMAKSSLSSRAGGGGTLGVRLPGVLPRVRISLSDSLHRTHSCGHTHCRMSRPKQQQQ